MPGHLLWPPPAAGRLSFSTTRSRRRRWRPRELHGFDLHLYSLYGTLFVGLHLNLYELVRTCMPVFLAVCVGTIASRRAGTGPVVNA
jgi:hypothetical protein